MKTWIWLILLPIGLLAQVSENFSDGNFTIDPTWSGTDADWIVEDGVLRSNGPQETGTTIYLSTSSTALEDAQWEFFANPKASTSSGNFMDFILASDQDVLDAEFNGYFVRIGGTPDEVSLYRKDGEAETILIDGVDGLIASGSNNPISIRVTRDAAGNWALFRDLGATGFFLEEGSAFDDTYQSAAFTGMLVRYSQANNESYFFDDIEIGAIVIDQEAPEILNVTVLSGTELLLEFNEVLESMSAMNTANYEWNGENPLMAEWSMSEPDKVALTFDTVFPINEEQSLNLSGLSDLSANEMDSQSVAFTFAEVQPFDILITELFPDPTPVVGLPEAEFIELHNRSNTSASLQNWLLTDGSAEAFLGNVTIDAGDYLIICGQDNTSAFQSYGNVHGVSPFPSLNNDGDFIELRTSNGALSAIVDYNLNSYDDVVKKEGGWTLEMIDIQNPCQQEGNWRASENALGGTPGQANSVAAENPDLNAPEPVRCLYRSLTSFSVLFNEIIGLEEAISIPDFFVESVGAPIEVSPDAEVPNAFLLKFQEPFVQGELYTLQVSAGIRDCVGNSSSEQELRFAVPEAPEELDVVINEILPNPYTGGVDYVELLNISDKTIDLRNLRIGNGDLMVEDVLIDAQILSSDSYLLFSGDYVLLTENTFIVSDQYTILDPRTMLDIPDLPSYDDAEGVIQLVDFAGERIDLVHYYDDWHHPIIDDKNGVSLERISPSGESNSEQNWQSAGVAVGFGTPGYENSNFYLPGVATEAFSIEPLSFSPDGDTHQDIAFLHYEFDRDGYTANVQIFNDRGLRIKTIASNELLALEGSYKWDGSGDDGRKAVIGKYIWMIEAFHPDGETIKEKKVITLAGRLN